MGVWVSKYDLDQPGVGLGLKTTIIYRNVDSANYTLI